MKKFLKKIIIYFITLAMTASVFAWGSATNTYAEWYPPYDGTGNLIENGDCSSSTGWTYYGGKGYATFSIDGDIKSTVTKFDSTDRTKITLTYSGVKLKPNKEYKISFWMKSSETIKFGKSDVFTGDRQELLIRVMKSDSAYLQNANGNNVEFTLHSDEGTFDKDTWKKVEGILSTANCESNMTLENYMIRFFMGTGSVIIGDSATRTPSSPITITFDNFELKEIVQQANIVLQAVDAEASAVELTGGGSVGIGQKATIKAAVKTGAKYVFDKWVDSDDKFVSSDPIYTFVVAGDATYKAVFKQLPEQYQVKVSTNNDSFGTVTPSTSSYNYDSTVTLTASPKSGYVFVCWEDNGKKVSNFATYNLTVKGNHNIKAYFAEENKHKVIFKDPGGRIIKVESVENGKDAAEPSDAEKFKPGYEFIEWDKNFSNITGETEVTAIYRPLNKYNVSVQGGTITAPAGSGQFDFDTKITVKANIPNFKYWRDNLGNIVSYDDNYSFYVSRDVTLIAKSSSENVQKQPVAIINNVIQGNGTVSFIAQCTVPTGEEFTIVECGVLLSNNNKEFDLASSDAIRGRAELMTDTGQFMITKEGAEGEWHGRAYVICRDGNENLITVYSSVESGTAQ